MNRSWQSYVYRDSRGGCLYIAHTIEIGMPSAGTPEPEEVEDASAGIKGVLDGARDVGPQANTLRHAVELARATLPR